MNEFGRKLGLQEGDEIIEFNGEAVNIGNMSRLLSEFYENTEPGDKVKMLVARKNEDGEYEEEKLKARAMLVDIPQEHVISIREDASPRQIRLRKYEIPFTKNQEYTARYLAYGGGCTPYVWRLRGRRNR